MMSVVSGGQEVLNGKTKLRLERKDCSLIEEMINCMDKHGQKKRVGLKTYALIDSGCVIINLSMPGRVPDVQRDGFNFMQMNVRYFEPISFSVTSNLALGGRFTF